MTEAELAQHVIAWLESLGGDVYQEVEVTGGRADIVARMEAEIWIVETKKSLSLQLIEQVLARRYLAHRVYLACPVGKARSGRMLCRELGIGMIDVVPGDPTFYIPPRVSELIPSRRWNTRPVALGKQLDLGHKTHARAGAPGGGHWTEYRRTCEALAGEVARHGSAGVPLRDALSLITHHYASNSGARSTLAKRVAAGLVPGVRIERGRLYTVLQTSLTKED